MKNKTSVISTIDKRSILFESVQDDLIPVPDGMMRVHGTVAEMDVLNNNGRYYSEDNYKKHVDAIQPKIKLGLYGEMEHPESFGINYNNISHKIEKLWYDNATNEVKTIMLLLDNEKGKTAQSVIKSGGALRCSTRCAGDVIGKDRAMISKFYTIDLVGSPGFEEAQLFLMESLNFSSEKAKKATSVLNESLTNVILVTEIKNLLLESEFSKKSNKENALLLEHWNERTRCFPVGTNELYESIKSKILKR